MALERVLQQLNSQGQFDISISEGDNPYGFHKQILTTPIASIKEQLKSNVTKDIDHDLIVFREQSTSHGTAIDDTSIILETQEADKAGFQLGEKVKLLHAVQDIDIAVATISSTSSTQLHNRLQPHGYYKVSIEDAIVGDAPLMDVTSI